MADESYGDATASETTVAGVDVDPKRAALVKQWCEKVKADKKHHKNAFERMRKSMRIASEGSADEAWVESDKYVVPVINRHINQAVATLYARNPKASAKRKEKLLYTVWDGDPQSLQTAVQTVAQAAAMPPAADPLTGAPVMMQPDPQAVALIQEVEAAKQEMVMYDRLAKTMQILFEHYFSEQDSNYKAQIKAMVRRAKVCGVGYVDLGFQRRMGKNPDIEARIADAGSQLGRIETLMAQTAADQVEPESAKAEELRLLVQDLQSKVEIILREGPVLSFPRATEIIPDRRCRHLKTFAGSRHVTHEFHMECDEVLETYGVDLKKGAFTPYKQGEQDRGDSGAGPADLACVWKIQDKQNGQALVVCDGYSDFLKEPAEPDVKLERFWTLFPLVFNEIESEEHIFPPSDVWTARHMQRDYNNAREGLREHRIANRPRYHAGRGKLELADKDALQNAPAHAIIESSLLPSEDIGKVLQRVPAIPIDPALYETESAFADIQRVVGSQEANLGGVSGATATETSIAENSRMTASADNTDDLDMLLTDLARAMGQLMLLELSIDTVREIAGPGAVWPQMQPKREEIVKDLLLEIEAGSSGRPNEAADLANFERAAPWVVQIPGLNPTPIGKRVLALLKIDAEDALVEGMPSITAMNQMASKPVVSSDPNQQGDQGGDNAVRASGDEPGAQPAYPAPADGNVVAAA